MLTPTPLFRWKPVPGAAGYDVTLESVPTEVGEEPAIIPVALEGSMARVGPDAPLSRGVTYRLHVRATRDPGLRELAIPPEARFMFRVLSDTEADRVRWARHNAARTPVASTAVLYGLEMYADAAEGLVNWPAKDRAGPLRETADAVADALRRRLADPN